MQFNPLFIKQIEAEDSATLAKNKKVDNSNYLFSDIINVYISDEETLSAEQSPKVIKTGGETTIAGSKTEEMSEVYSGAEPLTPAIPTVLLPLFNLPSGTEGSVESGEALIKVSGLNKTDLSAILSVLYGKEVSIKNTSTKSNTVAVNVKINEPFLLSHSEKEGLTGIIRQIQDITGNTENSTLKLQVNENSKTGLYDLAITKTISDSETFNTNGKEIKETPLTIKTKQDEQGTAEKTNLLHNSESKSPKFSQVITLADEETEKIVSKYIKVMKGSIEFTSEQHSQNSTPKILLNSNLQSDKLTAEHEPSEYESESPYKFTSVQESLKDLTTLVAKSSAKVRDEQINDKNTVLEDIISPKSDTRAVTTGLDESIQKSTKTEKIKETFSSEQSQDELKENTSKQLSDLAKSTEQDTKGRLKESAPGFATQTVSSVAETPVTVNTTGLEIKKILITSTEIPQPEKTVKVGELINELEQFLAQKDKESITIKLSPGNLGKVKIVLRTVEQFCSAKIEVETETAKKIVEQNISQLYRGLQQQGVQMQSIQVFIGSDQKQQKLWYAKKKLPNEKTVTEGEPKEVVQIKRFGYNTYEYLA